MNRTQIARFLHTTAATVDEWVNREGMPCRKQGSRGRAYTFDPAACLEWARKRDRERASRDELALLTLADDWTLGRDADQPRTIGTWSGESMARLFEGGWPDLAECVAWSLPFVSAGKPDSPEGWRFAIPHVFQWLAQMAAMLERYGVNVETSRLGHALRDLRVRARRELFVPSGFDKGDAA